LTGSDRGPGEATVRRRLLAGAAALAIIAVLAYLPAILDGGFVWDDRDYVVGNVTLDGLDGLFRMWADPAANPQYYPLVYTTFWLEKLVWGLSPAGYHLVNVLLHASTTVVFYLLLVRFGVAGAWPAAALFCLHPMNVESVAWVTERKNVLAGLLTLLAAGAWLTAVGLPDSHASAPDGRAHDPTPGPGWRRTMLPGALFAAALLAKTAFVLLPAALLAVVWWRRGRVERRDVISSLPLFGMSLLAGLLTWWVESVHVGARGAPWDLSIADRILIAGRAVWFYLGKLVAPVGLSFIYPRWRLDAGDPLGWLFPAGVLGAGALLWAVRNRIGRGGFASAAWFVLLLAPALGFIPFYFMRYSFVADRYVYLAALPLFALAGSLGARLMGGLPASLMARRVLAGALTAALLVPLGSAAWRQCRQYRDEETLWRETLRRNPSALMARINLGNILTESGRAAEGEAQFRAILAADPGHPEAHYNLGNSLAAAGKANEAEGHYRRAVAADPGYLDARINLASLLARTGRLDEAVAGYREVLRMEPRDAAVWADVGLVLLALGRIDESREALQRALDLDPRNVKAGMGLEMTRGQP
jgi:tetratricopeptide (TPR) repeat protein